MSQHAQEWFQETAEDVILPVVAVGPRMSPQFLNNVPAGNGLWLAEVDTCEIVTVGSQFIKLLRGRMRTTARISLVY